VLRSFASLRSPDLDFIVLLAVEQVLSWPHSPNLQANMQEPWSPLLSMSSSAEYDSVCISRCEVLEIQVDVDLAALCTCVLPPRSARPAIAEVSHRKTDDKTSSVHYAAYVRTCSLRNGLMAISVRVTSKSRGLNACKSMRLPELQTHGRR
jgi:hypothetical protein